MKRTEKRISELLSRVGVGPQTLGGVYLREAIMMWEAGIKIGYVYQVLAVKHQSTWSGVERCIRNQVQRCATSGNLDLLEKVVGWWDDSKSGAPTNSQFIASFAAYIDMED